MPIYCDQVVCTWQVIRFVADVTSKMSTLLLRHQKYGEATRDKKKVTNQKSRTKIGKDRGKVIRSGRCTVEEG